VIRTVSALAAVLLSVILVLNSSVAFGQGQQKIFSDLDKSHWAYENIMKMTQTGLIAGYPDGSFRPDAPVTHGEFIRMATIAAGLSSLPAKQGEHWGLPYYNTGLNNFLFTRYDISEKHLDKPIKRGHMALISSEIIKDKSQWDNYSEVLERIEDVDYRTQYEHHIVRAYSAGILAGYPDGTFRPFETLNRAEAAAVIQRLQDFLLENRGQKAAETDSGSEIISEEELSESERDTRVPLIDTEPFDTSVPKGTFMARVRNFHIDQSEKTDALKQILCRQFPEEGEAIFNAFISFSKMDSGGKDLGICKQYVMEYPVLFNLVGDGYDIMVFPKDFQDEYWETEPGQVNVFFI
jgi:hypothetical protein